jgi:DNA-binding MarR family transcriptional regulator
MRLGEIARETALTAATTSDAVSTLDSKGLVEKRRALDDGRALAVRLTARGRTAAKRATQWPDFLAKAVGTLHAEEQSLFYRTRLKTVRQFEVQDHIAPHRMCVTCVHFEPGKNPKKTPHHCELLDLLTLFIASLFRQAGYPGVCATSAACPPAATSDERSRGGRSSDRRETLLLSRRTSRPASAN